MALLEPGSIVLSSWLKEKGYSFELQKKYRLSGWLQSIGSGAMVRLGDEPKPLAALQAIQQQANMTIHPGGKSALSLMGMTHDLLFSNNTLVLFGEQNERLPKWMLDYEWLIKFDFHATNFLPGNVGLTDFSSGLTSVKISSPVRAVMECLHLARTEDDLVSCYQLMEGLGAANPKTVQSLLEKCGSVKVLRLFLFMAKKAGHTWYNYLNLDYEQLNFGRGSRSVTRGKGGIFVPEFQLIIPRKLIDA